MYGNASFLAAVAKSEKNRVSPTLSYVKRSLGVSNLSLHDGDRRGRAAAICVAWLQIVALFVVSCVRPV